MLVGQHLNLDVPRVLHKVLDEDVTILEGRLSFG